MHSTRIPWLAAVLVGFVGVDTRAHDGGGGGPLDVLVTDFSPSQGGSGTVVRVDGRGFGPEPTDICAVVLPAVGGSTANLSIPLEVLSVHPDGTSFEARLGPVPAPPDGSLTWEPGPIAVFVGVGDVGTFQPTFADLVLEEKVRVWSRDPVSSGAASQDGFLAVAGPPLPGSDSFFAEPPNAAGELSLYLAGDWPEGSVLDVRAGLHSEGLRVGHDLRAPRVRLDGGGSLLDCALRVCDIVRSAFERQAVAVACGFEQQGDGRVKLTLRLPPLDGAIPPITWGNFTVCVSAPVVAEPLRIDDIRPRDAATGTPVAIFGSGFGDDPDALCVSLDTGGTTILLDVLGLVDTDGDDALELLTAVPPLPTHRITAMCEREPIDYQPAPLLVVRGDGERVAPDRLDPASFGAVLPEPVRLWQRNAPGAQAISNDVLRLFPPGPVDDSECFLSDPPSDRLASVAVDWWDHALPNPDEFVFEIRFMLFDAERGTGAALHVPHVFLNGADGFPPDLLCDTITNTLAFAGVPVDCRHDEEAGRIDVLDPAGRRWSQAGLEICFSPPMPTAPMITDISPRQGDTTTPILIEGCGFPNDPNDVCLAIRQADSNQPIPLLVGAIDPASVRAIPPWCPWTPGIYTGNVVLRVGRGVKRQLKPVPGYRQIEPAWAWEGQLRSKAMAVSEADYTIDVQDVDTVDVLQSAPPQGGFLDVDFGGVTWPRDWTTVVQALLFDDERRVGYCLSVPRAHAIDGAEAGSPASYGRLIREAFADLLDVEVIAEVGNDVGGNEFLRVGLPDGQVTQGVVVIGVEELPSPGPLINDFSPTEGTTGTRLTIIGENFLPDADDICAGIVDDARRILPIHIDQAGATEMQGAVAIRSKDVAASGAPIVVRLGDGLRELMPPVDGLGQSGPTWVWAADPALGLPPPRAVSTAHFQPIPSAPPAGELWVVADPPRDGALDLFLRDGWQPGSELDLSVHALDEAQGLGGCLHAPFLTLEGGGSLLEQARRICEFVSESFARRGVAASCTAATKATDLVQVTLRLDGGRIDVGQFSVRVIPPVDVVIEAVSAAEVAAGDTIAINGSGFGTDPDDLSVVGRVDGADVPLRATAARDDEISALVGPLANFGPLRSGPIMVVRGSGATRSIEPAGFESVEFLEPVDVWAWVGDDSRAAFSKPVDFTPGGAAGAEGGGGASDVCFYGSVSGGQLQATIIGSFPSGTVVRLLCRMTTPSGAAYDLGAEKIVLGGGDASEIANSFVAVVRNAFQIMHGITVVSSVVGDASSATLSLSPPDEPVTDGHFIACVAFGSGDPGNIPGDCNFDATLDLSDAVCLLRFLFVGDPDELPCGPAGGEEPDPADRTLMDADGGGSLELTDAVRILRFLFAGEPPHVLGTDCVQIANCEDRCSV